jgi:hypothetical protein
MASKNTPAPDAGDTTHETRPSAAELQAALDTLRAREVVPGVWLGSTRSGHPVVIRRGETA